MSAAEPLKSANTLLPFYVVKVLHLFWSQQRVPGKKMKQPLPILPLQTSIAQWEAGEFALTKAKSVV